MDTEQRKVLEEYGYKDTGGVKWKEVLGDLQKQPKATYYKPTGEPMPNLPADPFFMRKYFARGFTLTPPEGKIWPPQSAEDKEEVICPVCGKECKSDFGLKAHMRKHNH